MTIFGKAAPVDGGSEDEWGNLLLQIVEEDEDFTNRLQGTLVINSPTDSQDEYLVFHARFPFDVKRVAYQCFPSGTATLSFKIDGTNITGLNSLSATATKQTADASGANSVAVGNPVTVTPTSIDSAVERIVIGVWGDRTAVGTGV